MQTVQEEIKGQEGWTEVILPESSAIDLHLKDVWRYRDLLMLLVKRDFVATYKQTILGPVWFFIQPLLTTLILYIIFSRVAHLSTDGVPGIVFYLSGNILWAYFGECLNRTSTVLRDNAAIFGKVYFPRLVMPLSIVISNLVKLAIQFALFLFIWLYFLVFTNTIHPNSAILLLPVLVLMMGGLGLGFGMVISAMTTKYRDLVYLLTFGVQLLMYATPVIYPVSSITKPEYKMLILANPMSSIIETFRYAFLGEGYFNWMALGYSALFTVVIVLLGMIVFNKVEKGFMDTV